VQLGWVVKADSTCQLLDFDGEAKRVADRAVVWDSDLVIGNLWLKLAAGKVLTMENVVVQKKVQQWKWLGGGLAEHLAPALLEDS
jgi:hypothetical protein